jgi:hypothetical protein
MVVVVAAAAAAGAVAVMVVVVVCKLYYSVSKYDGIQICMVHVAISVRF